MGEGAHMFEKSYMMRAFYQWCIDNKYNINCKFETKHSTYNGLIPHHYIKEDGTIILNISPGYASNFEIGNEVLQATVNFGEVRYSFSIDIDAIHWLKAKEIDEYLYLNGKNKSTKAFIINESEKLKEEEEEEENSGMKPEDIIKWLSENIDYYKKLLHIEDWHITFEIVKKNSPVSIQNEKLSNSDGGRMGDCQAEYQYKYAHIRLFVKEINRIDCLKRLVVHELAHVATDCVNLYTKYIDKISNLTDKEKLIAQKIRLDINELLAMQIENIVTGKEVDNGIISEKLDDADNRFRQDCYKENLIERQKVIIEDQSSKIDPYMIVEEEKQYDPYFWYQEYQKARHKKEWLDQVYTKEEELKKNAKRSERRYEVNEGIIIPYGATTVSDEVLTKQLSKQYFENYSKKIIIQIQR